ncbi:MAG: FAD-dependent monooxygenase, partial [Alphaproteobacteria bacterium]
MTKRTDNRRKASAQSVGRQTSPIAVIGGGATGYAAAIGLAAVGQNVTHFAPPVRDHPARTAALLQSSVDILTDSGVWPQIRDIAEPLVRMRLIDGTRRLIRAPEVTFDAAEVNLPAFGYNIANSALVDAMARQAGSIGNLRVIEAPAETVERSENGWRITWHLGETEAGLLVGADGRKSLVGDAIGVTRRSWSYPQRALVAIIQCSEPHQSTSSEFHCSHGPVTLVPLAGNQVSLVWVDQPERIAELLDQPDAKFAEILEERTESILGTMS